jgi:hypothetical protein
MHDGVKEVERRANEFGVNQGDKMSFFVNFLAHFNVGLVVEWIQVQFVLFLHQTRMQDTVLLLIHLLHTVKG